MHSVRKMPRDIRVPRSALACRNVRPIATRPERAVHANFQAQFIGIVYERDLVVLTLNIGCACTRKLHRFVTSLKVRLGAAYV